MKTDHKIAITLLVFVIGSRRTGRIAGNEAVVFARYQGTCGCPSRRIPSASTGATVDFSKTHTNKIPLASFKYNAQVCVIIIIMNS